MKVALILTSVLFLLSGCGPKRQARLSAKHVGGQAGSLVNFAHLEHLTEEIDFDGERVAIVHVYAKYPTYEWVDAKESGPEGIACVDDAGRAAVVYLRHYELTGDTMSLATARRLLRFVMRMQTEDGQFYNFIHADRTINIDGKTSYKSFGWWAARGVWCFGLGYRIYQKVDPAFAAELELRIQRTFPHIDSLLVRYGETLRYGSYRSPRWLLYEEAADATTELMLGLVEYYDAARNERVRDYIKKLADGLMLMQDGDVRRFPYGLHRSWRTIWHMWGNSQTQVLAHAGKVLNDRAMIESAEREVVGFYSRLLINGFFKEVDVSEPEKKQHFEQIAYGVRPMVVGLIRLFEATEKNEYLVLGGLAASWFFGNNILQQPMYDPKTGRCFDGIKDSSSVNRDSGAESTIEALHSTVEVEHHPGALKFINYKKVETGVSAQGPFAVFQEDNGSEVILLLDLGQAKIVLLEGKESQEFRKKLAGPPD